MIDQAALKEALLAATQVFIDKYNATYDSQVAVSVGDGTVDDEDILIDGGSEHGVFYISIMGDD